MKIVYDKEADAAYIYLKTKIQKGEVKKTKPINENILLDFDAKNKIIGIEILSASKIVSKQTVAELQTR